jgi:hypothetical protein
MHYVGYIERRRWGKDWKELIPISKEPCFKCGWNESYCDRHRIIKGEDGGKYILGNVISLCPNCHRIEHRGKLI